MAFDFTTIPDTLENLDDVPTRYQQFYDADGEKFKLTDLAPLKNANERVKTERDEWKAKAAGIDGWLTLGENPEAVKAKMTELEESGKSAGKKDQLKEIQSIKDQMNAQHDAEKKVWQAGIDTITGERDAERGRFHRTLIESEAVDAIAAEDGIPALLKGLVIPHITLVEANGKMVSQVLQEDGKTIRVLANGDQMRAVDLVRELKTKDEFKGAFKGSGTTGTGAPQSANGGGAGKSISRAEFDGMNPAAQTKAMADGMTVV